MCNWLKGERQGRSVIRDFYVFWVWFAFHINPIIDSSSSHIIFLGFMGQIFWLWDARKNEMGGAKRSRCSKKPVFVVVWVDPNGEITQIPDLDAKKNTGFVAMEIGDSCFWFGHWRRGADATHVGLWDTCRRRRRDYQSRCFWGALLRPSNEGFS